VVRPLYGFSNKKTQNSKSGKNKTGGAGKTPNSKKNGKKVRRKIIMKKLSAEAGKKENIAGRSRHYLTKKTTPDS